MAAAYWPERVEQMTGVPEATCVAAARTARRGAARAMVLTGARARAAVAGRRQHARLHQSRAGARAGRHARSAATARSPARATARADASTGRKPISCPAIAGSTIPPRARHVAGVWGIAGSDCPGRASRPTSCSIVDGPDGGVRALFVMGSNIAVSAPDAQRTSSERLQCARFPRRRPTSSCPRPRALADVVLPTRAVGGRGRHDDQPRGARHPARSAPCSRRRRRPHRPRVARARSPPALARRSTVSLERPARVFDELRRATAGGSPTTPASPTSGSTQRRRRVLAVPGRRRIPARRACSPRASRRRAAARASTPSTTRPGRGRLTRTIRCILTTGRVLAHYQSGTQTRRVPAAAGDGARSRSRRSIRRRPAARRVRRRRDRR